jgi:membrane-bound ClpP family serine protease
MSNGMAEGYTDDGTNQTPVGLAGTVVTPTRGKDGPGEVELRIRGGTEVFIARSDEPLPKGQWVLCVQAIGARTIVVTPWSENPFDAPDVG